MLDTECEARWLLAPFDEPPSAERFALHHLGPDPFVVVHGLAGREAETRPVNGRWRICVVSGLKRRDPVLFRWVILHEVCEHHLRVRLDYRGEDIERVAEAITAACAMPRGAFRSALSLLGEDVPGLADGFRVTQTAVALRIGEVVRPVALVAPSTVRFRSPNGEAMNWPCAPEVRRLAREGGPGLRRVRLTDARRRTALLADVG